MEGHGYKTLLYKKGIPPSKSLVLDQMAEGSSRSNGSELWRRLWNLPIPNVEKHDGHAMRYDQHVTIFAAER
jgi:hypothetical protein